MTSQKKDGEILFVNLLVQLTNYSDVLSWRALCNKSFDDRISFERVECLLWVGESKVLRQLVLP